MNKQKGLAPILIVLLIALVVGGYLVYQQQPKAIPTSQPSPSPAASDSAETANPDSIRANWKTYTNTKYEYSIKYPQNNFISCDEDDIDEETGLRLWEAPFDCPIAHDALYKIGVMHYKSGEYKEYKTPAATEEITVDGVKATKKTYQYTEADGPLFSSQGSTEVVIFRGSNSYVIQFLGIDQENLKLFDQILSTFKFIP